ncbi:MAG: NUDIX hydrolase [Zoogloeaceae bacterium]|jgi:ADP-ribose pyrophosphatase YjhB (NUDIX family)|nr:NUDIX hydrolase [Zoogloeaceae bacterium]
MNYCSHCGAPVSLKIPAGDTLPRHVCDRCGLIHYTNPKLVVGAIPEWGDRILLCRRAIAPRLGLWTLPAGFMENAETTAEAAARETLEEACARVDIGALFTFINVPHINQVHIFYRARLRDPDFAPGPESLEVGLFEEAAVPWQEIAFRTVGLTLRHYFEDRKAGQYGFYTHDLTEPPNTPPNTPPSEPSSEPPK